MEVTFWGVRGSIPAPGPATARYGGNTACVSVRLDDGGLVILDCGTGARNLGLALVGGVFGAGGGQATILLSHPHWDHIQGFPFFNPFYVAGNSFDVYGGARTPALAEEVLERQMAAQYFPVQSLRNMGARIAMRPLEPSVQVGAATITAAPTPHGNTTAYAFRIEERGRSVAYVGDTGYGAAGPPAAIVALCRQADLLIHDCSAMSEDRATRSAGAHSSFDDALACARAAGVLRLALFHYAEDESDVGVDELVAAATRQAIASGDRFDVIGSAEGLTVVV